MDPTMQFISSLGYVDLAWCLGDAAMADEHARRVAVMAARHGSPYLRVYSLACKGTAHGVAGDYDGAIRALTEGVQFLRKARAAMEFEPEMLASLADCLARKGAHHQAIEAAQEAIAIARQRNARLPECRASITLGSALMLTKGDEGKDQAAELFNSAETLIRVSGACIYQRLLEEARGLLAAPVKYCPSGGGQAG
jgi:adenylate cyclase